MMARALTDKSLGLFLPAFTSHGALRVQEESGAIQTIHKIPVAAPSWSGFVSRTLPAGCHGAGGPAKTLTCCSHPSLQSFPAPHPTLRGPGGTQDALEKEERAISCCWYFCWRGTSPRYGGAEGAEGLTLTWKEILVSRSRV